MEVTIELLIHYQQFLKRSFKTHTTKVDNKYKTTQH